MTELSLVCFSLFAFSVMSIRTVVYAAMLRTFVRCLLDVIKGSFCFCHCLMFLRSSSLALWLCTPATLASLNSPLFLQFCDPSISIPHDTRAAYASISTADASSDSQHVMYLTFLQPWCSAYRISALNCTTSPPSPTSRFAKFTAARSKSTLVIMKCSAADLNGSSRH
jgi:hypothetical protein